MSDLRSVRFVNPATLRVRRGHLNRDAVLTARPVEIDLGGSLCADCIERLGDPPAFLAVRLAGQEEPVVVLGDGYSDAVARARMKRLFKARRYCERRQHLDSALDYDSPAAAERRRAMGL